MTHSQRRINQEPVGGTLLCKSSNSLQTPGPTGSSTTSSNNIFSSHATTLHKKTAGCVITAPPAALECALHKQTWSRATQSACGTILGWMIQIGGRMLLQQIAKIQIHPSGAIFFRQFWRDFTDCWSWSLPSSPTTAENTFKWLISNQNATNKFQCVTSLKRSKGYF